MPVVRLPFCCLVCVLPMIGALCELSLPFRPSCWIRPPIKVLAGTQSVVLLLTRWVAVASAVGAGCPKGMPAVCNPTAIVSFNTVTTSIRIQLIVCTFLKWATISATVETAKVGGCRPHETYTRCRLLLLSVAPQFSKTLLFNHLGPVGLSA